MSIKAQQRAVHCAATLVALAAMASCGDSKSPWARKMTKAERLAWPTKCGIPADLVTVLDGQGDFANTLYDGNLVEPEPSTRRVSCSLSWNRDKDRLADVSMLLGRFDAPLAAEDIEPLLALALAELRPGDRDAVRSIALRERTRTTVGAFEVEGGFSRENRSWYLYIAVRR